MNILVVGLGLIGGSYAKAIKENTDHKVYGLDNDNAVTETALANGAIDEIASESSVSSADLTIVALRPAACVNFINSHAGSFKNRSIITDACGVKEAVYKGISRTIKSHSLRFVGAHPMAGKERGGFQNSSAELFHGASLIITPENADKDAVETVCLLAESIGFAKCRITDIKTHDKMIAYTSQLAHVLACSYIRDPLALEHDGFSAGSFKDVTRVATINEDMWTELFLDNAGVLSDEISVLIQNLDLFKKAIDSGDAEKLRRMMRDSRLIKDKI